MLILYGLARSVFSSPECAGSSRRLPGRKLRWPPGNSTGVSALEPSISTAAVTNKTFYLSATNFTQAGENTSNIWPVGIKSPDF